MHKFPIRFHPLQSKYQKKWILSLKKYLFSIFINLWAIRFIVLYSVPNMNAPIKFNWTIAPRQTDLYNVSNKKKDDILIGFTFLFCYFSFLLSSDWLLIECRRICYFKNIFSKFTRKQTQKAVCRYRYDCFLPTFTWELTSEDSAHCFVHND